MVQQNSNSFRFLLSTVAIYKAKDEFVFWGKNDGGLFSYDYRNNLCKYILREPKGDDDSVGELRYGFAGDFDDEVIFIPYNSKKFCVFNKVTHNAEFIDLDKRSGYGSGGFSYKECVFCFKEKMITKINRTNLIIKDLEAGEGFHPYSVVHRIGDHAYCGSNNPGDILSLNLESGELSNKGIRGIDKKICALAGDEKQLWLGVDDGSVVVLDLETDNIITIVSPKDNELRMGMDNYGAFSDFVNTEEYIYCSPMKSRYLIQINKIDHSFKKLDMLKDNESTSNIFRIDDDKLLYIVTSNKKGYMPTRQLLVYDNGDLESASFLRVDEGTNYKAPKYAFSTESTTNNLSVYIKNVMEG